MFGLFTDNKPDIIKAIGIASAEEIVYFEELKSLVLKRAHEHENTVYISPMSSLITVNGNMLTLPKKTSVRVQGSSREMFQALNQISKNAEFSTEPGSDFAAGDVGEFKIRMTRTRGVINIWAYIKNRNIILINLIENNG